MNTARWTIGPTTTEGLECLSLSIESFLSFHNVHIALCYNCCKSDVEHIVRSFPQIKLIDQHQFDSGVNPVGVAWKLHPTRIAPNEHEICIDNDIVFESRIEEIDQFFENDLTLLLEGSSRNYGRFEKHVPKGFRINSGIYGMPPGFNLQKHLDFYMNGKQWEINAVGEHAANKTFDEQGLVATALLNYPRYVIIPELSVTNCERRLVEGKGYHFIGLNKNANHRAFRDYRIRKARMCL